MSNPAALATERNSHILPQAIQIYRSHCKEIVKLLLPPSAFAYLFGWVADQQIARVRATIGENSVNLLRQRGLLGLEASALPLQAWILLKQWAIWICYCFALVGICAVVARINELNNPSYGSPFEVIREHPVRFLKSATLFFMILLLGFIGLVIIAMGITELQLRFQTPFFPYESQAITLFSLALVSAVIVRWSLAVPLAALGLPFGKALTASDHFTNGRSIQLWICIMESEIMGFIAAMFPFWLAPEILRRSTLTTSEYYVIEVFSFLAFALTQAPLMISVGIILAESHVSTSPILSVGADTPEARAVGLSG